jgi:hypothetical protein
MGRLKMQNLKPKMNLPGEGMTILPKDEISPKIESFERKLIGIVAILCGILVIWTTILGPMVLGKIQYQTSPSGRFQIEGAEFIYLVVLAPLCILGGVLHLKKNSNSKFILILLPITLMYNALSLGIGMEWSMSQYVGNSEHYFILYLGMIIGGLILLLFVPSMFTTEDVPEFNPRSLKIYSISLVVFMAVFSMMWIKEVFEVIQLGNTVAGTYQSAPNLFWLIRYLDLGFTIPLGYIGAYLLNTRPKKSYPVLMLFFGFFITMVLSVNSMGWNMWLKNDPDFEVVQLVVFTILMFISFAGFIFLIKHKLVKKKN